MNSDDLLRAIGEADARFVEESDPLTGEAVPDGAKVIEKTEKPVAGRRKKARPLMIVLPLAAAAVLIAGGSYFFLNTFGAGSSSPEQNVMLNAADDEFTDGTATLKKSVLSDADEDMDEVAEEAGGEAMDEVAEEAAEEAGDGAVNGMAEEAEEEDAEEMTFRVMTRDPEDGHEVIALKFEGIGDADRVVLSLPLASEDPDDCVLSVNGLEVTEIAADEITLVRNTEDEEQETCCVTIKLASLAEGDGTMSETVSDASENGDAVLGTVTLMEGDDVISIQEITESQAN